MAIIQARFWAEEAGIMVEVTKTEQGSATFQIIVAPTSEIIAKVTFSPWRLDRLIAVLSTPIEDSSKKAW